MISKRKTTIDYWFTIEPYVYISIVGKQAILYNTLDGMSIESDKVAVIELLKETLQKENCGVVLLTSERYQQKDINAFISELRNKYMGDIIDVNLSKGKPVQLLPFINFSHQQELYKKQNFSSFKNVLEKLSEISIYVDNTTNIKKLIPFLQSLSGNLTFKILGNIWSVENYHELLSFFDQCPSPKDIVCSYTDIISPLPVFKNNFLYRISVHFPLDIVQWENAIQVLLNQTLPVEYIFDVTSDEEYLHAEQIIAQYKIEKYQLNPVYTGENILFFEENVFLTKEDILSESISIKDFFSRQSMNIYDFGKINIKSNGDAYANINQPALGNIYTHNIHEIVSKEVEEGKSWFRIRDQTPCNNCVYQWLCPSPSNYEIVLNRSNLCYVKQ